MAIRIHLYLNDVSLRISAAVYRIGHLQSRDTFPTTPRMYEFFNDIEWTGTILNSS